MLNESELIALIQDTESDLVERTVSTRDTDKFCKAICAFANDLPRHDKPGYLIIGAYDNGSLSNLCVTDELLLNLSNIKLAGNILPSPAIFVNKYSLVKGEVAVITVLPSDLPPVRYKGTIWVRTGPAQSIANEQEEKRLTEKRISGARSFDALPCTESKLIDLAVDMFSTYRNSAVSAQTILENHRPLELQLASLRFYNLDQHCPTYAGILLFGSNPRYFLPGAYIQYLKYAGKDMTDFPEDQAEISGDLLSVLRELEIRLNTVINTTSEKLSLLSEARVFDYPREALREFLLNAIMHRDYNSNTPVRFYIFEDRIEITNPGGLYGEANKKNFPQQNSYRNPIIAEAMKILGYVERFGSGVIRAQAALEKNGNPEARFDFQDHLVSVIIEGKLV